MQCLLYDIHYYLVKRGVYRCALGTRANSASRHIGRIPINMQHEYSIKWGNSGSPARNERKKSTHLSSLDNGQIAYYGETEVYAGVVIERQDF